MSAAAMTSAAMRFILFILHLLFQNDGAPGLYLRPVRRGEGRVGGVHVQYHAPSAVRALNRDHAAGLGDPEAAAVLQRSESILRQAVDLYNKALRTPWRFLPGIIMGFRFYQEE